jgi:hypothetical protein
MLIYLAPFSFGLTPTAPQVLSRPGIAGMLPVSASSNSLASLVAADAVVAVAKSPLLSHAPAAVSSSSASSSSSAGPSAAAAPSTFVLAAAAAAHPAEDAEDAQLKTDETQNDY